MVFYVFRTYPHPAKFSLYFVRNFGHHRVELGTDASPPMVTEQGIKYQSPGEPIMLSVTVNSDSRLFEALPGIGSDFVHWRRPIQPFVNDGDDTLFKEMLQDNQHPKLTWGLNKIAVKVVKIGPKIPNEVATFSLHPAISKVHVEEGYGLYQWFIPFALPFFLLRG